MCVFLFSGEYLNFNKNEDTSSSSIVEKQIFCPVHTLNNLIQSLASQTKNHVITDSWGLINTDNNRIIDYVLSLILHQFLRYNLGQLKNTQLDVDAHSK